MFKKILIANRGEIAARIARTCKHLGISTVAVYSDADKDSVHVQACDEALYLGESPPLRSYLNVKSIIDAAKKVDAEAIHPGYGFLSEKAEFAQAVLEAGLVFVGPRHETLARLGDKITARKIAKEAGVPVVPGAEVSFGSRSELDALIGQRGFPLLVKAVSGGGGIGMQRANNENELTSAMDSCSRRAEQSFADARIFVEAYIEQPRHVEVQFFADEHGEVVALGDRECSVQRRHQKLIEESPAPAFASLQYPDYKREAIFEAAVRIAKLAGYVNAGTCEFIMDARGNFYFLEVNARLQVEHPVTEMCTGLDLVELQLRVACGEPMPDHVIQCVPSGHAIEARVCAEDPNRNFLPSPGKVEQCRWVPGPGGKVRIESGIQEGDTVTPYYDSMVAKVIAYDSKRHESLLLLDRVLAGSIISPLKTNIEFLRKVLNDSAFQAGQYDTGLIAKLSARM